jgi:ABC-2 type transport system permease protein
MIAAVRRQASIYFSFAAMAPKMMLAYSIWVWMELLVQSMGLVIFVAFWTAVYADQATIGGLDLDQTLKYIILARIFAPLAMNTNMVFRFGTMLREGQIGIELLRPVDFQAANYSVSIAFILTDLVMQIPLAIVGWLLYRFQLPTDPWVWTAFIISALLGNAYVFFFDWILGCAAFFITETWGLSVLRFAIAGFFSGALIPLAMMPDWLRVIATVLPFSQALYVPVGLLSGILPVSDAPTIWLGQIAGILVLGFLSRQVFRLSVRKVTVQGG